VAVDDASISSLNCRFWFGNTKTGSVVIASLSCWMASVCLSVHSYLMFFFVRSWSGRAIPVKFRMNGLWYPTTPKNFHTSVTESSYSV